MLTPSTTPTDATFSPASLQTPRTSTHFSDAFSPYIQSGNTSTPFVTLEHVDPTMYAQENMQNRFGQDAAAHHPGREGHDHFAQFGMTAQSLRHSNKHTGQATFHQVQKNTSVQTPPPTRNPSEKRRAPRPHSMMFGTPTLMDQSMEGQSLLDHGQRLLPQSTSQPLLSMAMDFSQPSMAMPDADFWNMSTSMSMNNLSQDTNGGGAGIGGGRGGGMLADPFTYQTQPNTVNPHTIPSNEQIQFLATTPQLFTPVQPSPIQRAPVVPSNADKPLPPVPSDNMPNMVRTSAGVDPNLLYSSPLRMPPPIMPRQLVPSSQPCQNDSLSPERIPQMPFPSSAASLATTQLSMQSDRNSAATTPGGSKLGLRRSNTTESRRPHSMYGSIESLSRSNTTSGIQRRASPLKRYNRNSTTSLASISESTPSLPRSRTSVVLTVDSKGRARTETRTMDPSPTKSTSMMARYPSLWDDSEDDSDSDETTGRDKVARAAKIDSTLASLEGLHLPRSSSSASNRATPSKAAIAAAIQLRRQSSVKKSQHSRRNTMASSVGSHMDVDAMDTGSDGESSNGDAGAALRKAMAERREQREQRQSAHQARSRPSSQARSTSSFPPRSSSLHNNLGAVVPSQQPPQFAHSFDCAPMQLHSHAHSHSYSQPQSHSFSHPSTHSYSQSHAFSPSKSSPIKPSGSYADAMSSITRCICNLPIAEGQLMIQCNSCQLWLHTACLGIPPTDLPSTYMCTFCMVPPVPGQRLMGWETTAAF
ncbi:hypothetical protein CAC42_6947 [Sphaceloma murrayae]|uniref:Zinc finger PHD-type domain-containing protein n=1 Tax=Sphaceloma murrayae TaxID=2082308 RepID=A0A2K1QQB2_9PEZI|nr:hypothetical protein CAC42_6947 [Sphaceloma murrayae]